jgi:hypothetical protein
MTVPGDRFGVAVHFLLVDAGPPPTEHRHVVGVIVLVLVLALVVALAAGEVVHRRRGDSAEERHGGFRLDLLAGASLTLAVVMCSFMLATAWGAWDAAARDAGAEAGGVSALFQAGSDLPQRADARRIGQDTICYARAVAYDEWPRLGSGHEPVSPQVDGWRVQLERDIRLAQERSTAFISSVPNADAQRSQTHYVRLVASTREPPTYLFVLLICVCATAIFFISAFTVHGIPVRVRVPVIGVVTALLVGTLAVIADLSHPYDGLHKVGPGFMEQVAASSARDYRLLWGSDVTVCTPQGAVVRR